MHVTTSYPGKGGYCLEHFLWRVICALHSSIQAMCANQNSLYLIGWGPKAGPLSPSVAHEGTESDSREPMISRVSRSISFTGTLRIRAVSPVGMPRERQHALQSGMRAASGERWAWLVKVLSTCLLCWSSMKYFCTIYCFFLR